MFFFCIYILGIVFKIWEILVYLNFFSFCLLIKVVELGILLIVDVELIIVICLKFFFFLVIFFVKVLVFKDKVIVVESVEIINLGVIVCFVYV